MKQRFKEVTLSKRSLAFLENVNSIIEDYQAQGYTLTLRQLYYQLVSRDIIANKVSEYRKLSNVISDARMSGLVDWDAIEDRTRITNRLPSWNNPKSILKAAAEQFAYDKLKGQLCHVEVWVEKDALSEIVRRSADRYHVRTLVNRGYGSVSAIYESYKRFKWHDKVRVLYLGDHDPSGLDMVRDIRDRVGHMLNYGGDYCDFEVEHIALTGDQIRLYNPPPNPAKVTDPRADAYISRHGRVSWEVDALEPRVLDDLITRSIEQYIDLEKFNKIKEREDNERVKLIEYVENYE